MRTFLIIATLTSCVDGTFFWNVPTNVPTIDNDCTAYCSEIQKNCTGVNAQYPNLDQCMHACASFAVGTSTVDDTAGNTLGCRIHYAVAASTMAAVECSRAGPAGDLINATSLGFCSGGDACASFCTLEIMACGSVEMPLPGNPRDAMNNLLFQYQNQNNCVTLCRADFDKTHNYSSMAMGDSLACRLNAAATASISVDSAKVFCVATADDPNGQCVGTPSP